MGYSTDLNDEQWKAIEPIFKQSIGNYGNMSKWSKRELTNAVLYLVKTGCHWRLLPNDFPPYSTVYSFYRRACLNGIWKLIMAALAKLSRQKAGKSDKPTYGLIDSQSVKTTSAADERGIDGGKKNQGP